MIQLLGRGFGHVGSYLNAGAIAAVVSVAVSGDPQAVVAAHTMASAPPQANFRNVIVSSSGIALGLVAVGDRNVRQERYPLDRDARSSPLFC
jgi:hypothetical protein